ncbi:hypothetical protein QH494_06110 [Sphingomonas sp. AR_OL41]|uniref:hypothetical protein n=1 Tax=Sphingomonas sp. AR_OL41 TaxID=3042729 RepID=UPI0024815B08|nr:hypothetical protein [Sphingomonas sp. AR_OL41]MDH7971752.1 hypothetical protein [Sphingomonas sp. AR_OL41]
MPAKHRPDPRQIDLFTSTRPLSGPAAHAGVEAWVAAEVATMLKDDVRSREEIAGAVSAAIGEDVSRWMLDAYASPARDTHNISFGKAIALMSVTENCALLEEAAHRLGGRILWGDEIHAARLGHLQAQRDRLDAEIKKLRTHAQPIERNRDA